MSLIRRVSRKLRQHWVHKTWLLRTKLQREILIKTRQGDFLVSAKDHGIPWHLYCHGGYEYEPSRQTIAFLKSRGFIPQDDVVLYDIGANIGVIAIGLARVGDISRAVAIEPDPVNFDLLCRNVAGNRLSDKITCLQLAVGREPGTLTLHRSAEQFGDHRVRMGALDLGRESLQVSSLPLDQIRQRPEVVAAGCGSPHLLWMDVQGFEGHVLAGAETLIQDGLPTALEIWPQGLAEAGTSPEEFARQVQAHWTDVWIPVGDQFTRFPISVFDSVMELIAAGGDYGNVILTKAGRTLS
jgi:FkbM family methyltransferase